MERVKNNINMIAVVSAIALSLINVVVCNFDYIYRPKSYPLFILLYLILTVGVTYFSIKYRKNASALSRRTGSFVPLFSLGYLITLVMCFDFKIDNRMNNIFYYELLFGISILSSMIIFFVYNRVRWLKICVAALSDIFAMFFTFVLFLSALLSGFGENTVVQTVESPDNTYVAWVISSEQGALGGSTEVYVRNIKKDINLVSGTLKTETYTLWSGRWGAEPVLSWEDNDTILIDGISYEAK